MSNDYDKPLTGLIYGAGDTAAQILGAVFDQSERQFISGNNARAVGNIPDRWCFASQHAFLADLPAFADTNTPVEIFVRRRNWNETSAQWRTGLNLLRAILNGPSANRPTLRALSQEAAIDLSDQLGAVVTAIDPRRGELQTLPPAVVDLEGLALRFEIAGQPRSVPLHDINWVRAGRRVMIENSADLPLDLYDLIAASRQIALPKLPVAQRMLFIVPNGVGLGHLTRLLAVAKALRARGNSEIQFWSYSQAAVLIEQQGFVVHARMTAQHLGASTHDWAKWDAADLGRLQRQHQFSHVVHDGSTLPPGLVDVIKSPECHNLSVAWLRRAMWLAHADPTPLEAEYLCDLILEPGEFSAAKDRGPTVQHVPAHRGFSKKIITEPVTATHSELTRRKARVRIGYKNRAPLCLVNLGGDTLGRKDALLSNILATAAASGVRLAWVRSPFARPLRTDMSNMIEIRAYPITPLLPAFDGIISAAGYNSFHEMLVFSDCPLLFVPNQHPSLDDQAARARFAADQGHADWLDTNNLDDHQAKLQGFFSTLRKVAAPRQKIRLGSGAEQMAAALFTLGFGSSQRPRP